MQHRQIVPKDAVARGEIDRRAVAKGGVVEGVEGGELEGGQGREGGGAGAGGGAGYAGAGAVEEDAGGGVVLGGG